MLFSNRLKQLRHEAGLSQMQLAIQFNLTTATISKYEIGQVIPDAYRICEFATFFKVSTDYILGLSEMRGISGSGTIKPIEYKPDEIELLELFKQLPDKYKYEVKGYIKGIISSNN